MEILTNLTYDKDNKIKIKINSRKEIEVYGKKNKGIGNYIKWLEEKNKCRIFLEEKEDTTLLKSEIDLNILFPYWIKRFT